MTAKTSPIYYGGTAKEWAKMAIDSGNENFINATIHYGENK